jgi:HSP20 family protein
MSTALSIRPTDNLDFFSLNFPDGFFKEMEAIHNEIAREAFGLFEHRNGDGGSALDDWLKAESKLLMPVQVSIDNGKDQVKVTAKVPGFALNELKVHIEGQELQIYGSSEKIAEKKAGEQESSTSSRKIFTIILLPAAVKADAASAILDKGVLTLTLPKAEPAKEIAVKAA